MAEEQRGSIEQQIQHVHDNIIVVKTKRSYNAYINQFIQWIRDSEEHNELYEEGEDGEPGTGEVKLVELTAKIFEEFILSLKPKKKKRSNVSTDPNQRIGLSTLRGHRSALWYYFKKREIQPPPMLEEDLTRFFKGLKRLDAEEKLKGERNAREGKNAMSFSLFRYLGLYLLENSEIVLDSSHSHLFLVLSWNLMCRSNSTSCICYDHLQWFEDALGVLFPKSKSNQSGEKDNEFRYVYANPLMPEVDPILSLGVYFLCHPDVCSSHSLFPGGNQESRFSHSLHDLLQKSKRVGEQLKKMGLSPHEFGTHSIRKGSGTYVTAGSTSGPSIVSICRRMGWSMGNTADRYLRFEQAGDNYLGRMVCGLPADTELFSLLPPHFTQIDEFICDCVNRCFPALSKIDNLQVILCFCMASVCFHREFIKQIFPQNHLVRQCLLFREEGLLERLGERVHFGTDSPTLVATGIPPHIGMMKKFSSFGQDLKSIPNEVLQGVDQLLEEKGAAAGNITRDHLKDVISSCLSELNIGTNNDNDDQNNVEQSNAIGGLQPFLWGGSFHKCPENFSIPLVDIFTLWHLWWEGNATQGIPPYRSIESRDFGTRDRKKRFSEVRMMMKEFEESAERKEPEKLAECRRSCSTNLVQELCDAVIGDFDRVQHTQTGRKRRVGQLKWRTVAKNVAKRRRIAALEADNVEEDA